jgi:Ca-activated chloride channel family protein
MRRVGWLLDEIRLRGESTELRDEVVDLARRHAIVTPYTSYLIVEDEARRGVPIAGRTLQELDRNREVQTYYRDAWKALPAEKSGDASSYNARGNKALKDAQSLESLAQNSTETKSAVASAPKAPMPGRTAPLSADAVKRELDSVDQTARVVNGKAFYQNGSQWIDADAQRQKTQNTRRIQFASDEYFKLLSENREAAQWLALGPNIQFTLGTDLIEITE